jgi:hypothetical protein
MCKTPTLNFVQIASSVEMCCYCGALIDDDVGEPGLEVSR